MGTRRSHVLVDTTPAKTILVYRNGDAFFVGRWLVVPRRRVPTFQALLEQLTEQVDVPFGVRRLLTPTRGHPVREPQALQAGGKYVAAVRRPFPVRPAALRAIRPVVHCDLNVPSRWQTFQRTSRLLNVFTNGRLFIPPVKIIIPKFSLTEWNSVLAMIGEKVFPLGGVQKLFTMNGHLLDNSKDLQDNHFYVAAGPETFRYFPYWKSSKVPSEEDSKGKETHKYDSIPRKERDSVFNARAGKKKTLVEPSFQSGSEGDVFRAQTPSADAQEAPEVKEDSSVQVEVLVDQVASDFSQVTISRSASSSPASGSGLTARGLEPVSGSVSPSLSAPPPFVLCLSLSQKK
uniref:Doublecortin domain containing 2C n=1 Tax=Lynx canadensis TaxID=61383 RepID=A0A667GFC0_LYNCA